MIFAAIPIRCGSLESGRFVIKTAGLVVGRGSPEPAPQQTPPPSGSPSSGSPTPPRKHPSALAHSGSFQATPPVSTSPTISPGSSSSGPVAKRGSLLLSEPGMTGSLSGFTVKDGRGVRGEIRFKNAYAEKPRVVAWVQRANFHTIERLPGESVRVGQAGFEFLIEHDDPVALHGSVINWIAVRPPPSNPLLLTTMEAIQAHTQPTLPSELEKIVNKFLKENSVGEMDNNGQTLLHTAAYAGNTKLVKHLLSKGARINAVDEHGWTALLCAISPGHFETALALIKAGADCVIASESDNNALHYLARWPDVTEDYLGVMRALLKGGCDPNLQNLDGDTPLTSLCQRNPKLEAIDVLLKSGASPNTANNAGFSPLHIAIASDNGPLTGKLLESGADPEVNTPLGSPIAFATSKNRPIVLAALKDAVRRRQALLPTVGTKAVVVPSSSPMSGPQEQKTLDIDVLEARDISGVPSDVYCCIKVRPLKHLSPANHTRFHSRSAESRSAGRKLHSSRHRRTGENPSASRILTRRWSQPSCGAGTWQSRPFRSETRSSRWKKCGQGAHLTSGTR